MSGDYRHLLVDASSGNNLGELRLSGVSFSRRLSDVGALGATLPIDDPMGPQLDGDREVTVVRDDVPVWNGPVISVVDDTAQRTSTITAMEASGDLQKRTREVNSSTLWSGSTDLFVIVRALVTYMTGKSSMNAALPRFNVTSGSAGTSKTFTFFGSARHYISDILNLLAADPTTGLDYCMDYATGSTRQSCQRTLKLGAPSLGTTRTQVITEQLATFQVTKDRSTAATRVHVVANGYTSTLQNTGSVTAGELLLEERLDRTDLSNHTAVDNLAREFRRKVQPPVSTFQVTFTPGSALPYGWCDLGDTVTCWPSSPLRLSGSSSQRVVEIDVTPPTKSSPEQVTLVFNPPLTSLGL